jgi:hypothetical protein
MSAALDVWQTRVDRHFTGLAASRPVAQFPIFALEHGLDQTELAQIADLLRAQLATALPPREHWLLWVIYATEFGYRYHGDEYWHSFEDDTPYWRNYVGRDQLRVWFRKFQQSYHGVVPSGPWAEQFSIIAWPITHAILPRYLQLQFGETLYAVRHRLARLDSLSPLAIGELLAHSAWGASSRFREFVQQQELAGRIVLALLDHGPADQSPIYPPTLQRLVSDLEQVRRAREWLRETRHTVLDRFKGAGSRYMLSAVHAEPAQTAPQSKTPSPDIRPVLILQRTSTTSWSPVVIVPSFAGVAELDPELSAFLKRTRSTISAASDAWLPGGWLLSGAQRRTLKAWPSGEKPVVAFERPHGVLQNLLDTECRISPGPLWVFRIGPDGIAREIGTRLVRPGQNYILVSRTSVMSQGDLQLSPCDIDCTGVVAATLIVPDAPSSSNLQALHQLGLQAKRTIRIWPAGLCGRSWDSEGHGECLTTETPCFGIVHDHPVDEYLVGLDYGNQAIAVPAAGPGEPVFIQLPALPPGRHFLSVTARRRSLSAFLPNLADADGFVALDVRDPRSWVPGTTSFTGLAVALDPPDRGLDAFWDGNVALSVFGPEAHSVTCSLTLFDAHQNELLSREIGTFGLPITPAVWSGRFSCFAAAHAWDYLGASKADFVIQSDDLGRFALKLERDVTPVRWICRHIHRTTTIRLIDDTGHQTPLTACFFPFLQPLAAIDCDTKAVIEGFHAEAPGGLFVAAHGTHSDTLVLSISDTQSSLQSLLIEPRLPPSGDNSIDIRAILQVLQLWSEARVAGPLAANRRDHIANRILGFLYGQLAGPNWARIEAVYLASPAAGYLREQLVRSVGGRPAFAVILARDHHKLTANINSGQRWFAEIAARYKVSSNSDLCTFALRMASNPMGLSDIYRDALPRWLDDISRTPVLLRGARLLALLSLADASRANRFPLPSWTWP